MRRRGGPGGAGAARARGVRVAAGLLVAVVAAWLVARGLYPYPAAYRPLIEREARRHGFDPLFVAAVVYVESRFDPFAVSSRGARGLMQLMPETGLWAARRLGWGRIDPDELFLPEVNVRLGTWYLAELRRTFGGDVVLMLAAYNGGEGNVRRWAERHPVGDPGADLERRLAALPFGETREFVRRVFRTYAIYRWLYRPWGELRRVWGR